MRRESSNEIKCNIRNSTVLQHMKNNNFTYQANDRLLQYPHFTVVVLRQYHKNFSNINSEPKKKFRLTQVRRPSQMAMLIRSKDSSSVNKSSSFTKAKWIQKNSFRQQNKGSITTGAKTCQQFFTKAMRSPQAFTHARMRSCTTHYLHVWEHV